MPRLVIYDDRGREVYASDVPRQLVRLVRGICEKHGGTMRLAAATVRAVRAALGVAAAPRVAARRRSP